MTVGTLLLCMATIAMSFDVHSLPRVAVDSRSAVPSFYTAHFDQPLDHFDYRNKYMFPQRIIINDEHWGAPTSPQPWSAAASEAGCKGPIIFSSCGEGDVVQYWNASGFLTSTLAEAFGALVVFAEHRYFGQTMPFGNASLHAENMGHLSSMQVLADYANLLDNLDVVLRRGTSKGCPVLVSGGSYSGMLATYLRKIYPQVVIGALASSAPFPYVGDEENAPPYGFSDVSQNAWKEATVPGAAITCDERLKACMEAFLTLAPTEEGRKQLTRDLNLCKPLQSEDDAMKVAQWVQNSLILQTQFDYPYPTDFGIELNAWPANQTCKAVEAQARSGASLTFQLLTALQQAFNATGGRTCTDTAVGMNLGPAWDYLVCTSQFLNVGIHGMYVPASAPNATATAAACEAKWGITARPAWPRTLWGGFRLKELTNVIFSSGLLDGWACCSVRTPQNSRQWVVDIPAAGHHLDLRADHPADPPYVRAARSKEQAVMAGWVAEYFGVEA